jgi:hypothetical protein
MRNGLEIEFGTKCWYLNDKLHREDGPAVVYKDGDRFWYLNGQLHRTDGPAVEFKDGDKRWFINGVKLSENDYLQATRNEKLKWITSI